MKTVTVEMDPVTLYTTDVVATRIVAGRLVIMACQRHFSDLGDDSGHGHSTQKPVECMRRPMQNHETSDVYGPFSGSGRTVLAAEQLGRRCLAIEIESRYLQVAIDRWEAFTGLTAQNVGEAVRV